MFSSPALRKSSWEGLFLWLSPFPGHHEDPGLGPLVCVSSGKMWLFSVAVQGEGH